MDNTVPNSAPAQAVAAGPIPRLSDAQLRLVFDVSRMLAVPTDLDRLLQQIAQLATELLGCERASIFLYDAAAQELWTKVALKSGEIRVPAHKGIVGYAFTHNQVVHVLDPYNDPRFNPEPDRKSGFVTRNLLTAPMKGIDGKPVGVLQVINKIDTPFNCDDGTLAQ